MTQTRDLIKKMADFFKGEEFYEKGEGARLELSPDDVRCMNEVIKAQPKIGHWVKHNTPSNTYYYDCSLCGCVAPCTETADSYLWKLSNYCPDCGARMIEPQEKRCEDCDHYGKLSLDCGRCDDDCSMYEPQESEKI